MRTIKMKHFADGHTEELIVDEPDPPLDLRAVAQMRCPVCNHFLNLHGDGFNGCEHVLTPQSLCGCRETMGGVVVALLAHTRALVSALELARPFVIQYGTASELQQIDTALDGITDAT